MQLNFQKNDFEHSELYTSPVLHGFNVETERRASFISDEFIVGANCATYKQRQLKLDEEKDNLDSSNEDS